MRKLFLFATVAAAGLLAGCSSSDDLSEGGNTAIENDGDKQAIKIGIGNMANIDETRGTGTVGGVGTGASNGNVWAGQRVNVFMFTKDANKATTLNLTPAETAGTFLYNNSVMITPGTAENLIPNMGATAELASGEAMLENGTINYYPVQGNYDFFGYHGDDATGAVAMNGNPTVYYAANDAEVTAGTKKVGDIKTNTTSTRWTVPFTIDGSQDLMSTKAILTHIDDDPNTNDNESEGGQDYIMSHATNHEKDYYSAYAARKGVQPTLTFDHLLTRLQFKVKAGDKESAGYGEKYQLDNYSPVALTQAQYDAFTNTTNVNKDTYWNNDGTLKNGNPTLSIDGYAELSETDQAFFTANYVDGYDAERAVKIEKIQVLSRETKGNMLVAWTADQEVEVDPNDANAGTYMPAYKKIEWAATQTAEADRWLTLKERPFAKMNQGAAAADEDVEGYVAAKTAIANSAGYDAADNNTWTTLKDKKDGTTAAATAAAEAVANAQTAVNDAQTALNNNTDENQTATLEAALATAQGNLTAAQTALTAANTAKTTAENNYQEGVDLEAALRPTTLMKSTISEVVYNKLTDAGKAKYTDIHTANINADLVALTPTAPLATDGHATYANFEAAQTPVGESLIIAPNAYDETNGYTPAPLKMRVTISQKVPTNWNTPREYKYRESSYDLDIPVPGGNGAGSGAFKINNSYNIVLTVYGFSRIDVIAEVEQWLDGGNLTVGED